MGGAALHIRAFAKINLGFEVLGKRPDGLHEIATIMQTIDLADDLILTPSDRIGLRCEEMEVRPDNLILQAAYLMKERAGVSEGVAVECVKHIPVGGGLGGGSADAAAMLCALWNFWDIRLDAATLRDVAGQLGADVPFCLKGGTALATGSGRELEELPDAPAHWVVLVSWRSGDPEKTGQMYRRLGQSDWSDGAATRRQAQALREGRIDYDSMRTAFTRPVLTHWTDVGRALAILEASDARASSVSGAGPSTFGLYESRAQAEGALHELQAEGITAKLHHCTPAVDLRSRCQTA